MILNNLLNVYTKFVLSFNTFSTEILKPKPHVENESPLKTIYNNKTYSKKVKHET